MIAARPSKAVVLKSVGAAPSDDEGGYSPKVYLRNMDARLAQAKRRDAARRQVTGKFVAQPNRMR